MEKFSKILDSTSTNILDLRNLRSKRQSLSVSQVDEIARTLLTKLNAEESYFATFCKFAWHVPQSQLYDIAEAACKNARNKRAYFTSSVMRLMNKP